MAAAPSADGLGAFRRFRRDFGEGVDYIRGEKGLLIIAVYFMASNFCYGADSLRLPFFRNHPELFAAWPVAAVTLYSIVSNFDVVGRFVGGLIQYKTRFPADKKFAIAYAVYVIIGVLGATVLYLPIPLMALGFFLSGILGVTSYTIRTAATQVYIPDTKRARFNGVFQMMMSVGNIVGSLTVGTLAEVFPERGIITVVHLLSILITYLLMYRGREYVAKIYNRDL